METPSRINLQLSRSEAIALGWLVELGEQAAEQRVMQQAERIKFNAAQTAADKLADALNNNSTRCVTVGQLTDLVRLVQQGKNSEVHWLLAKMLNG